MICGDEVCYFNSVSFLIYFPIVVLINFVLPKKARNIWLFGGQLLLLYVLECQIRTVDSAFNTDYLRKQSDHRRHRQEMASEDGVFSVSGEQSWDFVFFKYFQWILDNINQLFHQSYSLPFSIPIAGGNFFYTFQALGYTIDVYQGDLKAEESDQLCAVCILLSAAGSGAH